MQDDRPRHFVTSELKTVSLQAPKFERLRARHGAMAVEALDGVPPTRGRHCPLKMSTWTSADGLPLKLRRHAFSAQDVCRRASRPLSTGSLRPVAEGWTRPCVAVATAVATGGCPLWMGATGIFDGSVGGASLLSCVGVSLCP